MVENKFEGGTRKLFKLVTSSKIHKVIITYQDRLIRFGFEYLKNYFNDYGAKIITIHANENKNLQAEMVDELIAIITSLSGKIYGQRGRESRNITSLT